MYTYLNQKYGLRSLIIEYASAIIRAANKFADTDTDVKVFVRILRSEWLVFPTSFASSDVTASLPRNEIDEEFRSVQAQLKDSVEELLGIYLKGKHPMKPDDTIRDMLSERLQACSCQSIHCYA